MISPAFIRETRHIGIDDSIRVFLSLLGEMEIPHGSFQTLMPM